MEDMPSCLRLPGDAPKIVGVPRATVSKRQPKGKATQKSIYTPDPRHVATLSQPLPPFKPRPRVLFVSHDLSRTGSVVFLKNLLPHLRGMDVEITALTAEGSGFFYKHQFGAPCRERPAYKDYDLVVANTLLSIDAVEDAAKDDVPLLWVVHEWNPDVLGLDGRLRSLADFPRKWVFLIEEQAENFAGLCFKANTSIIPAVAPKIRMCSREESCRFLKLHPDAFHVLSFGTDEPRKGHSDLRAATAGLDVKLHLISGSSYAYHYLNACDVYCCSSRNEVLPLSIQEAKHLAKPVIAADLPGCRRLIQDGKNGFLYQPGDTITLRSLIVQLQQDNSLRIRLSQDTTPVFSFEKSLRAYERLFLSAAGCVAEEELHVVYHIAGLGPDWRDIVNEQLDQLHQARLMTVLCTHCGEGLDWCLEAARKRGIRLIVASHHDQVTVYERPAVELVERLAWASDLPILYLHTKGVSHLKSESFYHEWRNLLMEHLVMPWRQNLRLLESHDAVGVNWHTREDHEHFSGNFWLVRPNWIRQLPRVKDYWRDRWSAERWIGSRPGCNARSLVCQDAYFWDRDRNILIEARKNKQNQPAVLAPTPIANDKSDLK